ncbi:MAG: bifunctional methionine sulfoxide reductase B/A protein [Prevotellaceae bacterium]|jgi:peptide methionine sulfoxide reductase msrA/msrB|nr:bifunctional methionine sulfoxide reductase B/A protein [Prevotellaceae bacterium]
MKNQLIFTFLFISNAIFSQSSSMKYNKLTPEEEAVIVRKGTERPFTGKYSDNNEKGTYICKRCDSPLFRSSDKFESNCGWPSFDDEIAGAIVRLPDSDGRRTEIVCSTCGAHLGHVFLNEGFTVKNTRHCVNSISMKFIKERDMKLETAYFASGCFWGTEYHFLRAKGVVDTCVGFMGGKTEHPTYQEVCRGHTGHAETTEVLFDPSETTYEELLKLFFETHDFTQVGGQGPDIGDQYRSVVFHTSDAQKQMAEKYVKILMSKVGRVSTDVLPASTFWPAEDYHQEYYHKKGGSPYCHIYRKVFD